jgi:hypothetical protein
MVGEDMIEGITAFTQKRTPGGAIGDGPSGRYAEDAPPR